jgi:hypothetical protein
MVRIVYIIFSIILFILIHPYPIDKTISRERKYYHNELLRRVLPDSHKKFVTVNRPYPTNWR